MRAITYISAIWLITGSIAQALPTDVYSFTGDFYEDFNSMGATGSQPPTGESGLDAWELQASPFGNELLPRENAELPSGENPASIYRGYNGGDIGSSDRALGIYAEGIGDERYLVCAFRNDTDAPLNELYIYYDMKILSAGADNRWGGYSMSYSLDGGATWTSAGNAFKATATVNSNSRSEDGWLDEAIVINDLGGQIILTTSIPADAEFYLKFDGRGGITPPRKSGKKQEVGVFIDNLEVNLPSNSDRESPPPSTYGFPEWLSEHTASSEEAQQVMNTPSKLKKMVAIYATGHALEDNLNIKTQGKRPLVSFNQTPGRQDISISIQASKNLIEGIWEDIYIVDGQGEVTASPEYVYEISQINIKSNEIVLYPASIQGTIASNSYYRMQISYHGN